MELILATNNLNKVREIKEILGAQFPKTATLKEKHIVHETVEDCDTFYGNALKKAREISEITGEPALADDSGLCVEALGGAPGVFSARYASDCDKDASDEANRRLLLKNMENITDRRAYFTSVVVLYLPDGRIFSAEGRFYGEITYKEAGQNGFGYDPLFFVPEYNMTSAEMSAEMKNSMSHRGRALRKLAEILKNENLGN